MAVQVLVLKESAAGEKRVAATPETVKKLVAAGARVDVEAGAGLGAGITDQAYVDAGAQLAGDDARASAELVLCVQAPPTAAIAGLRQGATLVGTLHPQADEARGAALQARAIQSFPLERLPRTTRAQAMDVLSSQAGMAGYKAVLIAAQLAPRFFPMLTTAAGTIRPSKVLIVGAGVAGLQAIVTARRLGAQVEGFDVRPETREQIESLAASSWTWGSAPPARAVTRASLPTRSAPNSSAAWPTTSRASTWWCVPLRCPGARRRRSSPRRWWPG